MLLAAIILAQATTPSLTLDLTRPGLPVSPVLYGLMTEEINYSYDGGLYGELLRNRTFQDDANRPSHWTAEGSEATLTLEKGAGFSSALPVALKVRGGVANDGYWGIPVRPGDKYKLTLVAKASAPGPIVASIESLDGKTVYASAQLKGVQTGWGKLNATLTTARDLKPTADIRLVLRTGADRDVWLGLASLFPSTYKGRQNGNRPDLMRMLVDMKPQFLRFPGGNYVEGGTPADWFNWKKTLGPIEERSGHWGTWGYRSSDGMGLLEFLYWCEEMKAQPVLAVFAGYSLRGDVVKAGPELQPFVQEALDEIEYVTGGPDTVWGARRVKDGHPKPFPLKYVEVGNEDGFDRSGSYPGRFAQFYKAIKAKYPQLSVISTTGGKDWLGQKFPIVDPKPDLYDEHYYASTWDMMAMATKYDSYDRSGPKIFVGEWASHDLPEPWSKLPKGPTPKMFSAISDAAFMTGLERNSDIVDMACYAPLLVNVNPGGHQWPINMIGYNALTSFGSPSYYAQKMFATNLGDRSVALNFAGVPTQKVENRTLPGMFASATIDSKTRLIHIKLVNALPTAQEVAFDLQGTTIRPDGTWTVMTGDPTAVNTIAEPTKVAPTTSKVSGLGTSFRKTLPAYSVNVLTVKSDRLPSVVTPAAARAVEQGRRTDEPNRVLKPGENPILRDHFTADPATMVYKGTVYLYTGHDEAQGSELFTMKNWLCYTSKDMKNWTSHGPLLSTKDFAWSKGDAWASQVIEKNGKFYWYVAVQHDDKKPGKSIGVAVADTPLGPFRDARGSALVTDDMTQGRPWDDIDPTLFTDKDGATWMAWGNGNCYMAKLKPNMVELDGPIQKIELSHYVEGPWLHRRGNLYYLTYAGFDLEHHAENISYATAPSITGPWTYRGVITGCAQNSFTIHPAILEFKNQWYLVYHNANLTLGGQSGATGRRSVCLDYLYYNPDGTIRPVTQTKEGVSVPPKG